MSDLETSSSTFVNVEALSDSAIGPRSDLRRTSPQVLDDFDSAAIHRFADDVSAGSDEVELVAVSGE